MIIISIHALRGEGDVNCGDESDACNWISIHALRGEGDAGGRSGRDIKRPFQSTPSVGRATIAPRSGSRHCAFQSTPSVGRATSNVNST